MIDKLRLTVNGTYFWGRMGRSGGGRYARYDDVARYLGVSKSTARRWMLKAEKLGLLRRVEVTHKNTIALNWFLTDEGHDFRLGWVDMFEKKLS